MSIQQNLLRVACPKMDGLEFRQMRRLIRKTADAYKRACEREGAATPLAILFSECALRYEYNITPGKVQRQAERIQRLLPHDIWVSVHFAAMEKENGTASNMGYFLTKDACIFAPKRAYTAFDEAMLGGFERSGLHADAWVRRGLKLSAAGVPFPSLATPTGVRIEHRVCIDIASEPAASHENTLTLVSAHKLQLLGGWLTDVQADGRQSIINYDMHGKVRILNAGKNSHWQWSGERASETFPIFLLSKNSRA